MDSTPEQLAKAYLELILKENEVLNLTRITDAGSAAELHLEDSLAGLPEVLASPEGPLVDLGSGGGFPGVPLALYSGRETLLVDSRTKKMAAVARCLKQLDISTVSCSASRIEEIAIEQGKRFSVATARALAPLPVLLELAAPLLALKGHLVAYKSNIAEEDSDEFSCAQLLRETLGMALVSYRRLVLGKDRLRREIIVFEKIKEPSIALPRRVGLAQKRPLV